MEENKDGLAQNPAGQQKGPQYWHGCRCGACQSHRVLRWILGVVILLVVFWLGMMAGGMRGHFGSRAGYGRQPYPMMRSYNYGTAPRMMGAGSGSSTPAALPRTTTGAQ